MKGHFIFIFSILLLCSCQDHEKDKSEPMPDVIVVLGSGFAPDSYSFMGSENHKTPFIDEMANQGFIFDNLYVPTSSSFQNMISLFSATHPRYLFNSLDSVYRKLPIPSEREYMEAIKNRNDALIYNKSESSFAAINHFKKAGYRSCYIGSREDASKLENSFDATYLIEKSDQFEIEQFKLLSGTENQPLILFMTTDECSSSECGDEMMASLMDSYKLLDRARKAVFIYTDINPSSNAMFRSPLIIAGADMSLPSGKTTNLVTTMNILPTISELLGLSNMSFSHQKSLVPLMEKKKTRMPQMIIGETSYGYYVRKDHYLFFVTRDGSKRTIYDLANDPFMQENMIEYHPAKVKKYVAAIKKFERTTLDETMGNETTDQKQ